MMVEEEAPLLHREIDGQEKKHLPFLGSDMDSTFRDATLKAPLWEHVSRKLLELGYKRSSKKCKAKFENVQKYYKRTKETQGGRHDGKAYKFLSRLEALHTSPPPAMDATPLSVANPPSSSSHHPFTVFPPPLPQPQQVSFTTPIQAPPPLVSPTFPGVAFPNVVQRLTGISSGDVSLSLADRLAAENASPRGGKEPTTRDETAEGAAEYEPRQFLSNQLQYEGSRSVYKVTNYSTKQVPLAASSDSFLQWLQTPFPLLKLRFINSPAPCIFTNSRIKAQEGSPIAIELVDTATNGRVNMDMRLKILVLNADITQQSLTTEDFNRSIVRTREGKRPLLFGHVNVTLKEGLGMIGRDMFFKYDLFWLKKKKIRLGAKDMEERGVVEAISEAFVCKNHYGVHRKIIKNKFTKPHPRPSPLSLHKIKKPPKHLTRDQKPVLIYAVSPKVLHTTASNFENVVRHLTGISSGSSCGDVSPAARLAATEISCSRIKKEPTTRDETVEIATLMEEAAEMGCYAPGILSPSPAMIPTASGGMFPPAELDIFAILTTPPARILAPIIRKGGVLPPDEFGSFAPGILSPSPATLPAPMIHQGEMFSSAFLPTSPAVNPFSPMTHQGGMFSPGFFFSDNQSLARPLLHKPPSIASEETLGMRKGEAYENVDGFLAARSPPKKPHGITVDERPDFSELSDSVASSISPYYNVVIRYKRGDVNHDDFISHLHAAFCRREISVHEDFDEVDGVPKCRVLILFLTSRYVPSDLLNILQHQQIEPLVVYPLFYRIRPSDLISNSKDYERSFLQDELKRWQAALKEIAQMPGYILTDRSESELIDEIVRDAYKVLCSVDEKNMIGMDMQIKDILSLIFIESPDVRSIGIWGTVGIGKTAIAEEIFRRISLQYETCVFLKDFHEDVKVEGQDAVREDFLSRVLEVESSVIRFSDIKESFLRKRLQHKKVLLIVDDVNDFRDVGTFLGELKYFGPGSRIIITSRNRRVFVLCKFDNVYEVKPLDVSNSLLLLEHRRFRSALSPEVYRTLSLELVKYSNGNPLVLELLSMSDREWNRLSEEAQKTSPIYIPGIFERSCCGLDDNEKSIFLDIACFFRRMDRDYVAMLLDGCGFSAHVGFRSLVDKTLLTISHNLLDMLRFIQVTGREIVRQESADRPRDRSRLWNTEDIRGVFIDDTGTSAIEGIFLDMSKLKFDVNPKIFEKMCNIRLLKFYFSKVIENHGVSLPQGLEYLPSKLRLLHWEYYPLSSLPRSFDPKNLVELNLPNSCAKKLWKGKKNLEKLRKMRLSYSYQLTKIPRLSNAPNLEHIDLEGCNSLVSISQSTSSLKKLVFLNLKNCSKLENIPSTVDLESLEVLNLSGCSKLEKFPEISPSVKELCLSGTMIQEIPSSIKNLVLLEKLDLENNRYLLNLPTSICKLKNLETLNLSGCTSLERFLDLSRRMKCLKSLDLSKTAIRELPSSISYLTALEEVRFVDCKSLVRLPDNAWSLRFKVEFRQIDTEKFSRLWNKFGWLKKVQVS